MNTELERLHRALESFCNVTSETDRYVPLSNLTMRLLELAQDASGNTLGISGPPPVEDILFYRNNPSIMRKPDEQEALAAGRKPDILATRSEEKKNVSKSEKFEVEWSKNCYILSSITIRALVLLSRHGSRRDSKALVKSMCDRLLLLCRIHLTDCTMIRRSDIQSINRSILQHAAEARH
jgi:hypothetical protein